VHVQGLLFYAERVRKLQLRHILHRCFLQITTMASTILHDFHSLPQLFYPSNRILPHSGNNHLLQIPYNSPLNNHIFFVLWSSCSTCSSCNNNDDSKDNPPHYWNTSQYVKKKSHMQKAQQIFLLRSISTFCQRKHPVFRCDPFSILCLQHQELYVDTGPKNHSNTLHHTQHENPLQF